jgi:hypothetical protein
MKSLVFFFYRVLIRLPLERSEWSNIGRLLDTFLTLTALAGVTKLLEDIV